MLREYRALLVVVTVLGVVSGVAFSASYQLVARFANKNTISLGLGCVGSGVFALIIEIGLRMGPSPTRRQELWLFELTAGMQSPFSLNSISSRYGYSQNAQSG